MLFGWAQELGRPTPPEPPQQQRHQHESACCLTLPRAVTRHPTLPGRLWQEPLPGLEALRAPGGASRVVVAAVGPGKAGGGAPLSVAAGRPLALPGTEGAEHFEIEVR